MRETRNAETILIGKTFSKPHAKSDYCWKDDVKIDRKEVDCEVSWTRTGSE